MPKQLPSVLKQITLHLLPIPIVWWLLVLCGCPKGIAVALACLFAVGMWFILWTAIEWHDLDE